MYSSLRPLNSKIRPLNSVPCWVDYQSSVILLETSEFVFQSFIESGSWGPKECCCLRRFFQNFSSRCKPGRSRNLRLYGQEETSRSGGRNSRITDRQARRWAPPTGWNSLVQGERLKRKRKKKEKNLSWPVRSRSSPPVRREGRVREKGVAETLCAEFSPVGTFATATLGHKFALQQRTTQNSAGSPTREREGVGKAFPLGRDPFILTFLHHPSPPSPSQKLRHHVQRGSRYPRRRDRLPGRHRHWYVTTASSTTRATHFQQHCIESFSNRSTTQHHLPVGRCLLANLQFALKLRTCLATRRSAGRTVRRQVISMAKRWWLLCRKGITETNLDL